MSRKVWTIAVAGVLVAAVLLLGGIVSWWALPAQAAPAAAPAEAPAAAPAQQSATQGVYLFNYSVKFVCGVQRQDAAAGEPPVKPGNYATEINIHNYQYREQRIFKKLLPLVGVDASGAAIYVQEPKTAVPVKLDTVILPPDGATMDDCNRIWKLQGATAAPNMPVTIGHLVILSRVDLDIDAVYTAQAIEPVAGANTFRALNTDIDVERVQGKRVFVPFNVLQQFPTQPVP